MASRMRVAPLALLAALLSIGGARGDETLAAAEGGFDARFHFAPANQSVEPESVAPWQPKQVSGTLHPALNIPFGWLVRPAEGATATSAPQSDEHPSHTERTAPASEPEEKTSAQDVSTGVRMEAPGNDPQLRPIATGRAGYYEHPGRTASGEKYRPNGLTAAHRTLPLGTRLQVVNLQNGKSVMLRVNDRTPRKVKRIIDLSRGSARAIGITRKDGIAPVALYAVD
jgi:hypothetical protein